MTEHQVVKIDNLSRHVHVFVAHFHFQLTAVHLTHKRTQGKTHRSGTLTGNVCKHTVRRSVWSRRIFAFSVIDFSFREAEPSRANMAAAAAVEQRRVQEAAPAAPHCFWQER